MTDSPRTLRVRATLAAAVRIATGIPTAAPRPGQLDLVDDMTKAADPMGGQMAGIAPTGVGKALDVDTPIPTPSGWSRMGDLAVGDVVFDETGAQTTVLAAHDVQLNRDCYEVVFSDGATIVADGEHLWFTSTRSQRSRLSDLARNLTRYPAARSANEARLAAAPRGSAVTTLDVAQTLRGQGDGFNHAIPVAGAITTDRAHLLIDPYVLGAWLGDGSSNSSQITSADPEIIAEIERRGIWTTKLASKYLYSMRIGEEAYSQSQPDLPNLRKQLRTVGVLNDKHIPVRYLRASEAQRMDMLRGLMDTDGTVGMNGRSEICVVNERLARGIHELVVSLGFKASFTQGPAVLTEDDPDRPGLKRRRQCGTRYRVNFATDRPVALLKRKADRLRIGVQKRGGVRYIVEARPVASRPVRCITVSSASHLFLASKHMIPTHNSLSGLAEAAVGAVDYGERWLLSTESIGLQAQYVDKDGPVIAKAAKEVLGKTVSVAVLKGWSNHVCAMKTRDTAKQMGMPAQAGESQIIAHASRVGRAVLPAEMRVDGQLMPTAKLQPLVAWALRQHASEELPADRGHYEGAVTELEWSAVSVSPNECIGEQVCPLASICKPLAARQRAADADIVITNHSMLAVQAATGTPVVIGNAKLGPFSGIIVDEAHTLPGIVRSQGQSQISGRRIMGAVRQVRSVTDDRDPTVQKWVDDGKHLADYVDNEIKQGLGRASGRDTVKLGEDADPLAQTGDILDIWLRAGSRLATNASKVKGDMSMMIRSKRVAGDLDQAVSDLTSVREHWVGTARWLEPPAKPAPGAPSRGREWATAQSAPVQVGRMIERNLWNETVKTEIEDEEDEIRPLTVACISATLPEGFAREVGLKNVVPQAYASPFDVAYKNSMVFIPRSVDEADIAALSAVSGYSGKVGFDTGKHQLWAQGHILKLVEANRGSGLILSSTVAAGKKYAEALRRSARGRWNVYSQWDGENPRVIVGRWRDDKASVMVGTRSLMTGVDAPGETNTLVVVDRAPRAGSNPVDDARVELLVEAGFDKFTADRFVYVSDAVLLLEQAAGRLIRSISDSGMVAVLDPRMLNAGPFKYNPQARASYQRALERFPNKTSDPAAAVDWLRARAAKAAR